MLFDKRLVSLWSNRGVKLSKFYAVGGVAFTFEALVLTLNSVSLNVEPYIARLFSLPVASVIVWALNRKFTFQSKNPKRLSQYRLVLLNNGVSQAANYLIFLSILERVPAVLISNEITALLIAAVVTSMNNFLIGNYFIYRK